MTASLSNPLPTPPRETSLRLASYGQQGLWLLQQMNPGNIGYNLPLGIHLTGALNETALEESLQEILNRHHVLRTRFITLNGELFQEVLPHLDLQLRKLDLSHMPEVQREEEVAREARSQAQGSFDLEHGPLFRAALLRLVQQEYVLLITVHHAVSDGWSTGVLLAELVALYSAFSRMQPSPLPALSLQYADFAESQRQYLTSEILQEQLSFWRTQLNNLPPPLELPADRPEPLTRTYQGNSYRFLIGPDLTTKLRSHARENKASMFMVLLAAWQVLLYRYSSQSDILIGTASANRNRLQLERLIGLFVNTLVLRFDLSGDPDFSEVLRRTREVSLAAQEHSDLPFEKLVSELAPSRKSSDKPFFKVMFNWLNLPVAKVELAGLKWEHLEQAITVNRFDLMLTIFEGKDELPGLFEYSADLFDVPTMARFADHFKTLLVNIAVNPNQKISDLGYMTREELRQVFAYSGATTEYPRESSVCQLFEEQAQRTPGAPALVFEDQELTYAQLNSKANQLARHLQNHGAQIEDRIAIYMERSAEAIIALLAVLKSGGAYVAIDPAYPPDRIAFILNATNARLIITQENLATNLPPEADVTTICIGHDWQVIERESSSDLTLPISAENLAYIAYTSGSTGRPKGAAIIHRAIVRLVHGSSYARLGPQESIVQFAPIAFDASTFEIWGCLLNGGRLVVAPGGVEHLGTVLRQNGITTAWLTAGLFHWMVENQLSDLCAVPQLLAGGDVLSPLHVMKFLADASEQAVLINGYGPTENTTFTCCHPVKKADRFAAPVPVGPPIANTRVYVLDPQMNPVPVGVQGELFIGGDGLARCYWEAADLTAEKFLPDPYSARPGERLYRSGDRMRWLPNGILEFLGRTDNQIKIRGYRVELGEIESVLNSHPKILEAVVLAAEQASGEKSVVAYFSIRLPNEVTGEELRQHLRTKLPEYMVPSTFVPVVEFPLTITGKIDRKALAALPVNELQRTVSTPPRTTTEMVIAQIWSDVLGRKNICVEDDFFELGGHSLLATQITLRLGDAFQIEDFPLSQLFDSPTVAGLAAALGKRYDPETLEAISRTILEIQNLNPEDI
ncbi:MAG TPA: amino acid adenylation domain-containing protein [Candidatus Angelobacter sp.]